MHDMSTGSARSHVVARLLRRFGLAGIFAALLAGVALLVFLPAWRVDLTENHLYTLSKGTHNILANLKEPVELRLYYSRKLTTEIPVLRNYAQRVQEMLNEYVRESGGKLKLVVIEPEPFSEQEDEAAAAGLRALPNGREENVYLGLVGKRGDKQEIIEFFNPQQESTLEYALSQLVYRLDQAKPLTVGVMSTLPVFRSREMGGNGIKPQWGIIEQLQSIFNIQRMYDVSVDEIDKDINLLVLIHPHLLPEKTLYAIDQFVLRGGKLLVFVDPVAEQDDNEKAFGMGFADRSSDLEQLFAAWGVDYDPKKVVLDFQYAHSIPVSRYGNPLPHVGILGLHDEAINRDQAITANLNDINLASAGAIAQKSGASTEFLPLLSSSAQSQLMDADKYAVIGNHNALLRDFKADGKVRHFAALVQGNVKTAFPSGRPVTKPAEPKPGEVIDVTPVNLPAQLMESAEPIHVIVVADTDILSDRMWVQSQDFYGQKQWTPFAANGDLVVNMVDKLGGSADLISLRSRASYQRPFLRVDALEKAASERLQAQQDALNQSLAETEKKISELSPHAGEDGKPVELNAEQKAAIAKFQQEKMTIRKNLREVQRQLNQDVEQLGSRLKLVNLLAVPVVLTVLALLLSLLRARRARRG